MHLPPPGDPGTLVSKGAQWVCGDNLEQPWDLLKPPPGPPGSFRGFRYTARRTLVGYTAFSGPGWLGLWPLCRFDGSKTPVTPDYQVPSAKPFGNHKIPLSTQKYFPQGWWALFWVPSWAQSLHTALPPQVNHVCNATEVWFYLPFYFSFRFFQNWQVYKEPLQSVTGAQYLGLDPRTDVKRIKMTQEEREFKVFTLWSISFCGEDESSSDYWSKTYFARGKINYSYSLCLYVLVVTSLFILLGLWLKQLTVKCFGALPESVSVRSPDKTMYVNKR